MTFIRSHYRTIALALMIAGAFALIDQYILNASSYLCGALLAWVLIELKRKHKPEKPKIKLKAGGEPMKCIEPCNGKLKHITAKKPGGVEQYRCVCCKRKYEQVGGKLKQVAV